jgi:WD repeat-containing protein 48
MATSMARANYEERELAADATPYCVEPDDVLVGEDGLVRSVILNDRIHALTVDTSGEVAVWDIVRGLCLGRFLADDVASASHSGSTDGGNGEQERSPREALEAVRERIEGEAAISTWCTADTKAGVLVIHLTERCFDAEVYADEVGFSHDKHFNDESKREYCWSLLPFHSRC